MIHDLEKQKSVTEVEYQEGPTSKNREAKREKQLFEEPTRGDVKKAHGKLKVDMEKTNKKMEEKSVNKKISENQARTSLMISTETHHIRHYMKKRFNAQLNKIRMKSRKEARK
ncbi:hypothetical protein Bca4012_037798 [Brassica carinata]